MNRYQELWWKQASSDYMVFSHFKSQGFPQCHALHYLQMSTEKISKAYAWRKQSPPKTSHAGFVIFMRLLTKNNQQQSRNRLANLFGFERFKDFQNRISIALPVAYGMQNLAPTLAKSGPNPEYPWPHDSPEFAPVTYDFSEWRALFTLAGREFLIFVGSAIENFPEYADV